MKTVSKKTQTLLALHFAVFLFGLSGVFGKYLTISAFVIVFFRTVIAAVSLGIFQLGRVGYQKSLFKIPRSALLSGLFLAIHWVTFFYSIQISTVTIGILAYASFPLFVTILEPICFRVPITKSEIATALLVSLGLVLVVPNFDLSSNLTQGLLWGILSGFSFAALTLNNRAQTNYHPAEVTALWQNSVAALVLFPFAVSFWSMPSLQEIFFLLILGVLCTAVAHTLFIFALHSTKAHVASVTAALEAVYGILFAYLLLDELPNLRMIAGGILICSATVIASCFKKN